MRPHNSVGDGVAASSPALFPDPAERIRLDDGLSRALSEAERRVCLGPVTPALDIKALSEDLEAFSFERARPIEGLLHWTIAQLEHGVVHVNHPRYFGLFNPAATFPAQCADRIAAAFNPQLATATTSPAAVAIERHVIRRVAERVGLPPDASGHFTTGGAEANFTALICALTRADPAFASQGARAFSGRPVCYISADLHHAWIKIAHQAGIGREAMRLVETDGRGRMNAVALAAAVAADRAAGHVPVMIAATAGTTSAGMIDPISECRLVAARFNLWLHVDAAWGGAVIATDRGREVLAGIELADSVTIDAHKWFATTMGCGMFITRDPDILSNSFRVSTTYMPSNTPSVDPYVTSVQWSRRFLGLRLFLALAAAGWSGYAAHVEHAVSCIGLLQDLLTARGWRIANASPLAVLCFQPPLPHQDPSDIVSRVLASGRAWISTTMFEGRIVIRACVTHGETSTADVVELVDRLTAAL